MSYATVNPYSSGQDVSLFPMDEVFPKVDPQFKPFGSRVLIQLRRTVNKTRGGIILTETDQQTEAWNMQVGKVIAIGPLGFKNRATNESWPEGVWCSEGDFVRVPRWGGDRLTIPQPDGSPVVVVILNDHDLLGAYTGDPREVKAFIE